jgi:mRNA interferase MazF
MTDCSFGDVVLVPFPFTDQTSAKRRPAVVISSDAYHRERPDLILMAVTSQQRPASSVGEASLLHWSEAGLAKPSVLKPVLTTVERGLVIRKLGKLHTEDLAQLRSALDAMLGK